MFLKDGGVLAKGGIKTGLFFFEFLVVLRTLEFFLGLEDVIFAFENKRLSLHEWVWVRFNGEVDDEDEMSKPQKIKELDDGSRLEIWNLRRDRFDSQNNLISRFVLTTVGRVVMNYTIIDSVS